jgi:Icc-related predicted phosphoesterase
VAKDTILLLIKGYNIWGCPWTPRFFDWAFNAARKEDEAFDSGPSLSMIYNSMPIDTDIVICHSPPYGILDKGMDGRVGSKEMLSVLQKRNVKLYICGHIHEAYGVVEKDSTIFVNASSLGRDYKTLHKPIIIEL